MGGFKANLVQSDAFLLAFAAAADVEQQQRPAWQASQLCTNSNKIGDGVKHAVADSKLPQNCTDLKRDMLT